MSATPMEDLLRIVVEEGATDLHLSVGVPPLLRVRGELIRLERPALSAEEIDLLVRSISGDEKLRQVEEKGTVDFGYSFRNDYRFRISLYRQKQTLAMACRLIPGKILSLDEIGIPVAVRELLEAARGLILVTGPTGVGKTTSLASMLETISRTRHCHIITIEDPIEYYHSNGQGLVSQREIGVDVPGFAEGVRRSLRQDPDVILVGEMRDLETMEAAITAAETGHLVFSTLHTTGASRTVDRIIDAFPASQQEQIRTQLASNLKAVISQLLLPRANGKGMVAAFEIMINTPAISTFIRENKTHRINNDIHTGLKYGMISLDASLVDLYREGTISQETVFSKAQDIQAVKQLLAIQKPSGMN